MLPFREAVGVAPSAGVMLMLTSVLAAISAPLFTALPLAETVEVPVPVRLMVSLGVLEVTVPVPPPDSEPLEEPPFVLFEPLGIGGRFLDPLYRNHETVPKSSLLDPSELAFAA